MGHNSKIGYPYLPAREPWRGQDVLQRAWRATLPGPADDSGGTHSLKQLGGRPWRGPRFGTHKKSLAGDPGGDGGRPWRGRRFGTRKKSLAGDPGGDGALALAKRAWRATLAGTADDPGGYGALRAWRATRAGSTTLTGTALWHSQKKLAGRPGRPWRGRRVGTRKKNLAGDPAAKRAWRATLAGTADDPGGTALWHSQKELGGRPWRGRRTTLAGTALWHSQKELGGLAGDPGRDGGRLGTVLWHSQKELGGRPWRGRRFGTRKKSLAGDPGRDGGRPWRGWRFKSLAGDPGWIDDPGTRKKSLAGDPDDPGGDGALALAKRTWRATLAGTALSHSQKELGGRPWRDGALALAKRAWRVSGRPWQGRRTTRDGALALAKRAWRATLAGTALWHSQKELGGRPGRPWHGRGRRFGTLKKSSRFNWHLQNELGGRTWRGRRTTLAGTALWHSQKELGGRPWQGCRTTLAGMALWHSQRAWRATPAGTADDTTLAGTADDSGGDSASALAKSLAGHPGRDGGRPWRGPRPPPPPLRLAGDSGGD